MKPSRKHVQGGASILFSLLLLLAFSRAHADESKIETALKAFNKDDVTGYIQPFADFFGANMGAGWYHSAAIPQSGFSLSVNIVAMGSSVGDDFKSYTVNAPAGYNPATFQSATVFGGKKTVITDQNTGLSYSGIADGAIETGLFPLATLQLNIGSLYGTEFIIRGVPIPQVSGAPAVTFFGLGARHSLSQYLLESPVDIAAGVFWNTMKFGDLISMSSVSFGAQASKSFSVLEIYGGLAYEKSSMDLSYVSTAPGGGNVDISLDGANTFRGTIGLGLNLAVLHLFFDANFGSVTNLSAGLGFGF
jgi:hypothetical protein